MSPLILVGITLFTNVLADVSHVLQGQAHPPADPQEINQALNGNRNPKDFWWMQDDSPLKASYDYFKKCAATGKCTQAKPDSESVDSGESLGPIDIQKNAFLNGNFVASTGSSLDAQSVFTSGSAAKGFHSGSSLNLSNNPFLQGGFAHAGQSGTSCSGADRICVSRKNCVDGFASSRSAKRTNNGQCAENEICCRLSSEDKSLLADHINQLVFTPGKSKDTGKDGLTPEQVQIIHSSQEGIRSQLNFIGESSGTSTAKSVRDVTAAASQYFGSTPDYSNVRFGDDARFSNLDGEDYLPPLVGTTTTTTRTTITSCPSGQYLNKFGQCERIREPCPPDTRPTPSGGCEKLRPACPTGQQPGPYGGCVDIPTPRPPTCLPGQKQTPDGRCVAEPIPSTTTTTTTERPYCPSGQREGPNGQCIGVPQCGSGQRPDGFGGCVNISTPPTPPPKPPVECSPGYVLGSYDQCIAVTPKPPTTCGSGQRLGPYGGCVAIERTTPVPCPPGTIKTPSGRCETPPPPITCPPDSYLGSSGKCVRPQPPSTTSRTYLPPKTGSPTYTTEVPDVDRTPDEDVTVIHRVPGPRNPSTGNETDLSLIPYGCAAALKCVQEIYCTADGFVSPVPVVLTKEQELLRAPTTVCRDISSGIVGKCCRDRDYQDPWPSANLVNGVDDGRYAEDDSLGQYQGNRK